jgi:hypothetical protein
MRPVVHAEDPLCELILSEYENIVDQSKKRDLTDSRQLQLVVYLVIVLVISCLSRRSARKHRESLLHQFGMDARYTTALRPL